MLAAAIPVVLGFQSCCNPYALQPACTSVRMLDEAVPERWRSTSRSQEQDKVDVREAAADVKAQLDDDAAVVEWARNEAADMVVKAMYVKAAAVEVESWYDSGVRLSPEPAAAAEAAPSSMWKDAGKAPLPHPKKPLNEYQQFQKDTRAEVVAAGVTKPTEVIAEVARLWREKKEAQAAGIAAEAVAVSGFKAVNAVKRVVDWEELGRTVKSNVKELGQLGSALLRLGVSKAKTALGEQIRTQKTRRIVQQLSGAQMEALLIEKIGDGTPLTYDEVAAIVDPAHVPKGAKGVKALPPAKPSDEDA